MEMVEKFIQKHTRNCSNEIAHWDIGGENVKPICSPWLTPDNARKVADIAREETIKEVCEWIKENIGEYCNGENIMFSAVHIENIDIFGQERFIEDLKKAFESKSCLPKG